MKLHALLAAFFFTLPSTIPATSTTALDGHTVTFPHDLNAPATILILGFTHASSSAITAWEKPIRSSLATTPSVDYYDIAFLQDAPSFIRPAILHNIRKQVPDALKPHFLALTTDESAWKQAANFSLSAPDDAYILLIDRAGNIRYQTHEPYTSDRLQTLSAAARLLAAPPR